MRKLEKIIIHCSATPEGRDVDSREIRRWHLDRGWSDIGYHYVIRLDGSVEVGRALEVAGAHCYGRNATSVGICYVGGMDYKGKRSKDTRTPQQKEALVQLVQELLRSYGPLTVHGHNEFSDKDCPCFNVQTDLYPKPVLPVAEAPHSASAQLVLGL